MSSADNNNMPTIVEAIAALEPKFNSIADNNGYGAKFKTESIYALQAFRKSLYMQRCTPASFKQAIINVASVGLSLSPVTAYAYLVPRKNKEVINGDEAEVIQCCLDISYRGMIHLAVLSGGIEWCKAVLVYEGDNFEYQGVDKSPIHEFDPFSDTRTKIRGGYCIVGLSGDGDRRLVDFMSKAELDKVKATSRAANGPWKDWPEEMMKKTLIKRAAKTWPYNERVSHGIQIVNEHEGLLIEGTVERVDMEDAQVVDEQVELISAEVGAALMLRIKNIGVNPMRIFKAFGIDSIDQLPVDRYDECVARLDESETSVAASTTTEHPA